MAKFPSQSGKLYITKCSHDIKESTTLKDLLLCIAVPRGHDPRGVVGEHIRTLGSIPPSQNGIYILDTLFNGVISYEEVLPNIQYSLE